MTIPLAEVVHGSWSAPVEPRTRDESGITVEREALHRRFQDRLTVRNHLTRRYVSYQGNRSQPGLRWMRYKEGFSADLVRDALASADGPVLDPFAGIGTTALIAGGENREATAIEIMPVGVRVANAISLLANDVAAGDVEAAGRALLKSIGEGDAAPEFRFPHVPITEMAFSEATEVHIARARSFVSGLEEPLKTIIDVICMAVLEEVSFTRKDGQYLRWDYRCGRSLRGTMDKGPISAFPEAVERKIGDVLADAPEIVRRYEGRPPRLLCGSVLNEMAALPDCSAGLTITSPPYANRYDYTRTYALELAWLGYDKPAIGQLRQDLISATVENRSKEVQLERRYPRPGVFQHARGVVAEQAALHEALEALRQRRSELGNPHVIRLVENYFLEMAVVVAELARVTRPGGKVVMVNDNVQYHGEEIPVDLILSDIAEQCGFVCEEISVLPRGKGNASQQMGRFGRRELRKCVYHWHKPETSS